MAAKKSASLYVPAWLLELPRSLVRKIERLAHQRGLSEAELTERAINLVQKEQDSDEAPEAGKQETVLVEHVGRVSLDVARRIYRSIGAYFGGRTKLSKKERSDRARIGAQARWSKKKRKE